MTIWRQGRLICAGVAPLVVECMDTYTRHYDMQLAGLKILVCLLPTHKAAWIGTDLRRCLAAVELDLHMWPTDADISFHAQAAMRLLE